MIDSYSTEWLEIVRELDELEVTALKQLKAGVVDNADADRAAAWSARGKLFVIQKIKELPDKQRSKESKNA